MIWKVALIFLAVMVALVLVTATVAPSTLSLLGILRGRGGK